MKSQVRVVTVDIIQAFSNTLLLGFTLGMSYVYISADMYVSEIPYYNLGLLFFLFLVCFILGRIPVGLVVASKYRNFLGPLSMLLLPLAIFLFRGSTDINYLMCASLVMGFSTVSGSTAANSKLSEDFDSHRVTVRKEVALALGSAAFPISIILTTIFPFGYPWFLYYVMLLSLAAGLIFLGVSLFRFFVRKLRPTQDSLYNILSRTVAPLRAISKVNGKDYFLTALIVDTLFTFSAWAIVIYLPYYYILVTGSTRAASVSFALVSALYITMRFVGQRVRSRGFDFFSYFIRPIVFILAFFLLSLTSSENILFYSLLILSAVGLFEEGAKRYVLTRFDEDDRQIVERSNQIIKTPFTILAPAFSYLFFSISFSLGFASAIVPAAISLFIMMFSIGNPAEDITTVPGR